mmetsp:Transcript_14596/g.32179  ORF Transcript_14596/g.32179 Transcript_14596/m.32179 type:complete len:1092 (-) Transcript_14596:579-3854(-)
MAPDSSPSLSDPAGFAFAPLPLRRRVRHRPARFDVSVRLTPGRPSARHGRPPSSPPSRGWMPSWRSESESGTEEQEGFESAVMYAERGCVVLEFSEEGGEGRSPSSSSTVRLDFAKKDEIHAHPCQCALKYVGMQGVHPLILEGLKFGYQAPPCKSPSEVQALNDLATAATASARIVASMNRNATMCCDANSATSTSSVSNSSRCSNDACGIGFSELFHSVKEPDHFNFLGRSKKEEERSKTGIFRRSSETASKLKIENISRSSSEGSGLFGTLEHKRNLSGAYLFNDYHEFTLLKKNKAENHKSTSHHPTLDRNTNKSASEFSTYHTWTLGSDPNEEEFSRPDYYPWEYLTIRCGDHDEMDAIIKAVQTCSNATVVPFSPNPQRALEKKEHTTKLNNWSVAQWIDTARCEVCDIRFTLLSRRHHCRQCHRCVCSNCSSFMLVQGGEEARMCNRCTRVMHLDRSKTRQRLAAVAGKCHPACKTLGVGKKGQLPHWKKFFRPGLRVAVGSLTVEVIEALALPALDAGGKSDPYVRATLTGYVNDVEFAPAHRFTVSTSYCSSTLSPVWRGSGAWGGETLTLPVEATSGAVLRLEVMDYDAIGVRRDKNKILGVVEIPLCDLSNSNHHYAQAAAGEGYDGHADKWYYLQPPADRDERGRVPFTRPFDPNARAQTVAAEADVPQNFGLGSTKELLDRTLTFFRGPIDLFGDLTGIEFPRQGLFYTPQDEHRSPPKIHVRIKLYCSELGDLLSHAWVPLTPAYVTPPFDPQLTLRYGLRIKKLFDPYERLWKKIQPVLAWERPLHVCLGWYAIFAAHIVYGKWFLLLLHVYLILFFAHRLFRISSENGDWVSYRARAKHEKEEDVVLPQKSAKRGSFYRMQPLGLHPLLEEDEISETDEDTSSLSSMGFYALEGKNSNTIRAPVSSTKTMPTSSRYAPEQKRKQVGEDDEIQIHAAVGWIVNIFASGKQEMDKLQEDMEKLGRDLYNINKHWDGSDIVATRVAFGTLVASLLLHCHFGHRRLWLIYSAGIYFRMSGAQYFDRLERWCIGITRGIGKVMKRRALLALDVMNLKDELLEVRNQDPLVASSFSSKKKK